MKRNTIWLCHPMWTIQMSCITILFSLCSKMDIRNTRQSAQSIASRLFQFALSGTQTVSISTPQGQVESYNRLREQLFPSSQTMIPARQRQRPAVNSSLPVSNRRTNEYTRQRSNASMHPSFRSKPVCELGCKFCDKSICTRGMKAILLADTTVWPSQLGGTI
jgi:hypothetical protein